MNSEPQILELLPPSEPAHTDPSIEQSNHPSLDAPPLQDSTAPTLQSTAPALHPAFGTGKRGNGYVARLPKNIREQLNNMILDGLPYAEIITRLGEPTKHLNPGHLKEWKKYGYQDWLLEREWLDRLTSKAEFSTDILAAPRSSDLHEAGLRIAASQMFDQLMRFNAASETSASDQPEKFARLVNALSRLTREALRYQKYRDVCAQARAQLQKLYDPKRKLSDSERHAIVHLVDDILGIRLPDKEPDPAPALSS
jgi:hypothetical protein